ncbi:LysR family transcriptional regulator [Allopusillimonas soli]|uniref:LysR family transcriptional regulator n=1 Tax=Allopusillimonas soli TaxID=659016 RepID=A0A853FE69_9BURK|nr:LysR substrate-binding domain-containing protein [Allopusillimonas soli]NYT36346.1 LysR family transcriptional regulator [Allopusillimonas soli]TEA76664.1 LysR family transcriptional regulator [Allopusillimonas soli]
MLLREIEVFRTVMTSGTASKAAKLMGVSQPAISQALGRLEQHAGIALFLRVRGRLQPTPAAQALLIEVDRCFVGLDVIEHRLRSLRQFTGGRLNVASLPALGVGFLPRVLRNMKLLAEQRTVSLQIMSSREVRERLLSGQCDLGLMADEVSTIGLEHSIFSRLDGVIAIPASHSLSCKPVIKPQDLNGQAFIALNPEDTSRRQLQSVLDKHSVVPSVVIETPYSVSVCELVQQGVGLGLVSPVTALDYAQRGIVLRPFSEQVVFTGILAFPAGTQLTAFMQTFISAMRTQLATDMSQLTALMS